MRLTMRLAAETLLKREVTRCWMRSRGSGRRQLLPAVLAERLAQPISVAASPRAPNGARPSHECSQQGCHLRFVDPVTGAEALGAAQREPVRKDGQALEQLALGVAQERDAPVARGSQCPVSFGRGPRAGG